MEGVNKFGVAGWVIAILGAFATGFENGLILLVGYASQWGTKAPSKVKDWLAPVITIAACFVAFFLIHRPAAFPPSEQWVRDFAFWSLAALGAGSLAGHTGGAAKTNSL